MLASWRYLEWEGRYHHRYINDTGHDRDPTMKAAEIQIDLFAEPMRAGFQPEDFALLREQKWAHGAVEKIPLVAIELLPHEDKWMWSTTLCSRNGSGQTYRALPKWGKFAATKCEALERAVEEVRGFTGRATRDEQAQIKAWLGQLLAAALCSH